MLSTTSRSHRVPRSALNTPHRDPRHRSLPGKMSGAVSLALRQPLSARQTAGATVAQPPATAPLWAVPRRRRPAGHRRDAAQSTRAVLTVKLSNGDVAVDEVEALRPAPLPTTQAVLLEGAPLRRLLLPPPPRPPPPSLVVPFVVLCLLSSHAAAASPLQASAGRAGRATPGGARCARRCRSWPS